MLVCFDFTKARFSLPQIWTLMSGQLRLTRLQAKPWRLLWFVTIQIIIVILVLILQIHLVIHQTLRSLFDFRPEPSWSGHSLRLGSKIMLALLLSLCYKFHVGNRLNRHLRPISRVPVL